MNEISITKARDNLNAVVHAVETGAAVTLTRHGKAVAVILSSNEYERLKGGRPGLREAYQKFAATFDLAALGVDESEFPGPRDSEVGRRDAFDPLEL